MNLNISVTITMYFPLMLIILSFISFVSLLVKLVFTYFLQDFLSAAHVKLMVELLLHVRRSHI